MDYGISITPEAQLVRNGHVTKRDRSQTGYRRPAVSASTAALRDKEPAQQIDLRPLCERTDLKPGQLEKTIQHYKDQGYDVILTDNMKH